MASSSRFATVPSKDNLASQILQSKTSSSVPAPNPFDDDFLANLDNVKLVNGRLPRTHSARYFFCPSCYNNSFICLRFPSESWFPFLARKTVLHSIVRNSFERREDQFLHPPPEVSDRSSKSKPSRGSSSGSVHLPSPNKDTDTSESESLLFRLDNSHKTSSSLSTMSDVVFRGQRGKGNRGRRRSKFASGAEIRFK